MALPVVGVILFGAVTMWAQGPLLVLLFLGIIMVSVRPFFAADLQRIHIPFGGFGFAVLLIYALRLVPGAAVPDRIMQRMYKTKSKEEARETGLEIARETIREIRKEIAGVQVSMPFGNIKYPLEVLEEVL